MSRDSNAPDDPRYAAKMLVDSHADEDAILIAACELRDDDTWSEDQQAYRWVRGIIDALSESDAEDRDDEEAQLADLECCDGRD